jgi:hypothetical protein
MLVSMWGKGTLLYCSWERKLMQSLWKAIWKSLKNLKIELPYHPTIALLSTYPQECAPEYDYSHLQTMFIAALFPIVKLWKQPRCSVTDE